MVTEGEYEIVPVVKTRAVNPGDTVKIDVYCTSTGIPKQNRMRLDYDETLVSKQLPGEGRVPNIWVRKNGRPEAESDDENTTEADGGEQWTIDLDAEPRNDGVERTEVTLNPLSFDRNPQPEAPAGASTYSVTDSPRFISPPAEIEIRTDENCKPGDYEIPFEFAYPDKEGVTQITTETSVHVNSFHEAHRLPIASLLLMAGLLTVLTVLI